MNKNANIKPDTAPPSGRSPYFSEEHELLRAQVRRFVETEIKPNALAWEEQGYVPREVLRRMGSLGFFGIRYPARYGGSEMDTLATVVLAEELGRSTFSGVATTALVHSEMASIHVFRSGSEAQKEAVDHVAAVSKQIADAGISATSEVRISLPGRVAVEIVEESKAWGADAIVIGSRGLTNLAGIILGSTTHKLLHLSSLPVVVVR